MRLKITIGLAALALSAALVSVPAFAQQGPGAANYGAASNPQTGGAMSPAAKSPTPQKPLYDAAQQPKAQTSGGPGGPSYGAGSGPQSR